MPWHLPGVAPNLHVSCALVAALGEGGRWRQALEIYDAAVSLDDALHGAATLGAGRGEVDLFITD